MGTVTRLALLGLATALVIAATCFAIVCRERECMDQLREDAENLFRRPAPPVVPVVPPDAPEDGTDEPIPPEEVPDPGPDEATSTTGTEAPMASDGFYERLADLKRRFAEGATIQRVSRPAPRRLGSPPAGPIDAEGQGIQHLLRWKLYLQGLPDGFLGDPALDPLHPDRQ